ncbi:AraC family transcriptional regulator ligand-binding domain-containing protein [Embleya hyalina]|uniref:Putative HTH-type transcriptional regulator n=1 Tax=Embleya hyalina TaxID=516124 RepID=A0A401YF10_9ACTN|nr:AraC family transcriptional regulator ligand-binding domain-containing protein [Embleya hyalina]GCD93194.1 putative HTH-type transcriptional regulator [Embleya hyalina]
MLNGTVSARMGRFMVDAARRAGMDPARLVRLPDVGDTVLADEFARVSTPTTLVLWEQIVTGHPGAHAGTHAVGLAPMGTFGVWDYLFTSGETLAESLRIGCGHLTVIGDPGAEKLHVTDDGRLFTVTHSTGPAGPDVVAAVEQFVVPLISRRATEGLRRPVVPVRVTFRHRPPSTVGPLTDLLGTRNIDFDAPVNSITYLAEDAHAPMPQAQPGLQDVLRNHADMIIASARPVLDWHGTFRATLRATFRDPDLSLATIARRMDLGPRTLQRRLGELGTTWRDEVEVVREELAMDLIRDSDLPMRTIAARARFSDARALRRAVHRWHGTTPSDLRRRHAPPTQPGREEASPERPLTDPPGRGPHA